MQQKHPVRGNSWFWSFHCNKQARTTEDTSAACIEGLLRLSETFLVRNSQTPTRWRPLIGRCAAANTCHCTYHLSAKVESFISKEVHLHDCMMVESSLISGLKKGLQAWLLIHLRFLMTYVCNSRVSLFSVTKMAHPRGKWLRLCTFFVSCAYSPPSCGASVIRPDLCCWSRLAPNFLLLRL